MDTQKLSIAIQAFIKKQSSNAAYYEENWNERKERKAYYQSFTKDKLLAMTEEDFLEYISRLWAVLMWGNKKYVVDKLIEDNGFSTLKKQLADLLYGSASVEKRWDIFLKSVKGMGPATISELLSYMNPQEYIVFNKTTILCYGYLGIPNMPKYNYQYTGKKYTEVCTIAKEIASSLKKAGAADSDLLAVDYFLWDEILPLAEKDVPTTDAISISQEPVSARDSRSLHDEIKDKLVDRSELWRQLSNHRLCLSAVRTSTSRYALPFADSYNHGAERRGRAKHFSFRLPFPQRLLLWQTQYPQSSLADF